MYVVRNVRRFLRFHGVFIAEKGALPVALKYVVATFANRL